MKSVTIYFKDSERELVIHDIEQIIYETGEQQRPFAPVMPELAFFDDDKDYLFVGKKQNVFIRGSAILCVSVMED